MVVCGYWVGEWVYVDGGKRTREDGVVERREEWEVRFEEAESEWLRRHLWVSSRVVGKDGKNRMKEK